MRTRRRRFGRGQGLRQFENIIHCGQRGVNEGGAEGGRGNSRLKLNEHDVRSVVTRIRGD